MIDVVLGMTDVVLRITDIVLRMTDVVMMAKISSTIAPIGNYA
jgi:hypothetical protein